MKMRKRISCLLSAAIAVSLVNIPLHKYLADVSVPANATILFQDDFEGYLNGFTHTTGKPTADNVNGATLFADYSLAEADAPKGETYTPAANPANISQIASSETAGIGSGSLLMITAQSGSKEHQLIKASGITAQAASKALVFTTKFNVPDFVGYCDGVGIYLASKNNNNEYVSNSNTWNLHCWASSESFAGELMYLGSRPTLANSTAWWKPRYDVENKHNQLWTFGEKVADLTPGTAYTYTVTMIPDDNGSYTVTTNLNGTVKELGKEAEPNRLTIPTQTEMGEFTAVRIMRLSHLYYFMTEHTRADSADALSTWFSTGHGSTLGITTADNKYNNDRVVAYFDDMAMYSQDVIATPTPTVAPTTAPTAVPTVAPTAVPTATPTVAPTTVPTATPTAAPPSDGTVFSDDFESYTTIPGNAGWGNQSPSNYENQTFKWFSGPTSAVSGAITAYFDKAGTESNISQIVTDSGVGTSKALKITGQPYAQHYTMAKKSNLDTADISDKQLVFSVKFKAPSSTVIGEGFGVWVMNDKDASNVYYISDDTGIVDGSAKLQNELLYVGARANGANTPVKIYAFGEAVATVDANTVYDYKVTLTPDNSGKYIVSVTYNGITKQLEGTNVPTQAQIKTFNRLHISPTLHEWRVWDKGYSQNINAVPASAKDADGHYIVGRTVALIDDVKMLAQTSAGVPEPTVFSTVTVKDGTGSGTYAEGETVTIKANAKTGFTFKQWNVTSENAVLADAQNKETTFIMPDTAVTIEAEYTDNSLIPPEPIEGDVEYFTDDFESYSEISGLSGWSNNKPLQYDSDKFKYFYAETSVPSEGHEAQPYFGLNVGTPSEVSKIVTNKGVGSGKALEITGQTYISHYTMLKSSGITAENSVGKQIVFETTFKAPNPMTKGEGFGVWTFADANEKTIAYPSDDTDISKGTGAPLRNELLYVSTRVKAPSTVKIYAFGEEVAAVDHDTVYNYKLTLTPDENGGYIAVATVNGVSKTLSGTNVPTQTEMGTYNRVHLSPVTHEWQMWEQGFERSYNNVPDNVKGADGLYEVGRTLGIIDNISLKGCDVFEIEKVSDLNSAGEIALTSGKITLEMTGEVSAIEPSEILVNNNATVSASIDESNPTRLILTFSNLKAMTKYKINLSGILNTVNAEYAGVLELSTSDGVDVLPIELNGSADGSINRAGTNTVKVNIKKHALANVTTIPRVLVFVSKNIGGVYKNVKTYYAAVPMSDASESVEIPDITVGDGEVIRVFVWNDGAHMKPLTDTVIFD